MARGALGPTEKKTIVAVLPTMVDDICEQIFSKQILSNRDYTADMSLGEQMSMAVPKQLIYRRKHYLVTLSICTTSPFPLLPHSTTLMKTIKVCHGRHYSSPYLEIILFALKI